MNGRRTCGGPPGGEPDRAAEEEVTDVRGWESRSASEYQYVQHQSETHETSSFCLCLCLGAKTFFFFQMTNGKKKVSLPFAEVGGGRARKHLRLPVTGSGVLLVVSKINCSTQRFLGFFFNSFIFQAH